MWIQGDLHAENYGTYMNSDGRAGLRRQRLRRGLPRALHLGPAADGGVSLALLGLRKALPRRRRSRELIETYARAYLEQVARVRRRTEDDDDFALHAGQHRRRRCTTVLARGAAGRRGVRAARGDDRDRRTTSGVFADGPAVRQLDEAEQAAGARGVRGATWTRSPRPSASDRDLSYEVKDIVGQPASGSAAPGCRAYNLLVEGHTPGARERRRALDEAGATSPRRQPVVDDRARSRAYFEHEGHRTVVSPARAAGARRPVARLYELDGVGQLVNELSPYEADLDWDDITELDEMRPLVRDLGQATAKVHCVSDADNDHPLVDFQTEEAITDVIGDRDDEFVARPGRLRRRLRRAGPRGPRAASSTPSATG